MPSTTTDATILIVDDTPANLDVLHQTLEPEGYEILVASSGERALQIARDAMPDLILLDVMMPGINGFEACRQLKQGASTQHIPVIFITVRDETEAIVEGFRAGGVDYIIKPFQQEEVVTRIQTHLKISQLTRVLIQKNEELENEIAQRRAVTSERNHLAEHLSMISHREAEHWGVAGIVGESQTIQGILKRITQLQGAETTSVLITGESGTGKELVARAIHYGSTRGTEPFIPVNCSAIPRDLAESLLFGHVQGAFTGADTDQRGYFVLANGGTLFLDEIGDMPLELQPKMLRVLDDGVVLPVGATEGTQVNVRILAATNMDLQAKITEGSFRQDLYFRLARSHIVIPPLREHREDIPRLAEHFLNLFAADMGLPLHPLNSEALDALASYEFPGNVRELKNIIEHALIQSGGSEIQPRHLQFIHSPTIPLQPHDSQPSLTPNADASLSDLPLSLEQAEAHVVKRALAQTNGNVSEAARLLGTNRMRIYRVLAREESQGVAGRESGSEGVRE